MGQQEKSLDIKRDYLNLIPKIHTIGEKNQNVNACNGTVFGCKCKHTHKQTDRLTDRQRETNQIQKKCNNVKINYLN